MFTKKRYYSSVLAVIGALSLVCCAVEDDTTSSGPDAPVVAATIAFMSPAAAEAGAASLERLDDGSMVLAFNSDGVSFEAVVTEAALLQLGENPKLDIVIRATEQSPDGSVHEKDFNPLHSCVNQCGNEHSSGECFCDGWCILFGDCCIDYYDVCE